MTLDLTYYKMKLYQKAKEENSNRINVKKLLIPLWILRELERQGIIRFIGLNEIEILEPLALMKERKEEQKEEVKEVSKEEKEEEARASIEKYKGMLMDESNPLNLLLGYDDLKLLVLRSLEESNIHFLFVGPPATGKSLILEGIELLKPEGAYWIDGTHLTVAGLENAIINYRPRYLLIDEIDKSPDRNIWYSLLNLMEFGRFKSTKYKKMYEFPVELNIYATANKIDKLPEQLLDRFIIFHFREYTKEEIKKIIYHCLHKIAGYDEEFSKEFAEIYVKNFEKPSIRTAIRLAKLCRNKKDIEFVINTIKKYSP
ncbi:hypothetical protein DRN38_00180 [Thermococci archaeon]|nr:MAG: hypothetical protein DRN38_00180 [Thermococci archaeon]